MIPRSLIGVYQRIKETRCLHLQGTFLQCCTGEWYLCIPSTLMASNLTFWKLQISFRSVCNPRVFHMHLHKCLIIGPMWQRSCNFFTLRTKLFNIIPKRQRHRNINGLSDYHIFKKENSIKNYITVWPGFKWLGIWSSGSLLSTRQWNFGFHRDREDVDQLNDFSFSGRNWYQAVSLQYYKQQTFIFLSDIHILHLFRFKFKVYINYFKLNTRKYVRIYIYIYIFDIIFSTALWSWGRLSL